MKKHTRKGNKIVVTFYMDGGMFETSYTKTVGGSIDNNRYYNTIKISDDGAMIATIRVGNNVDDNTFAIKYIVGDHLNNSTAVLKTTGTLINREEYYPFGETSFGGFQYKRYRYNGKEKDEESGLYEYGQRYYAPWLCRFISVDPIAEDYPQLSSYNYAGNKPITSRDIEGLQSEVDTPTKSSTQSQTNAKVNNDGLLNIEVHQVKQEETISGLSKEYGVSQDAIRAANPQTQERSQTDQINIGEDIVIPMNSLPDSSSFGDYNSRDAEGLQIKQNNIGVLNSTEMVYPTKGTYALQNNEDIKDGGNNVKGILTVGGTVLGALENTVVQGDKWMGKDGNYYNKSWGGNGTSGGRTAALNAAKNYKIAGRYVFGLGALISGIEGINHFNNENYRGVAKSGLDIGMGALSTYGGLPGLAIGSYYFLLDGVRSQISTWDQTNYSNFYNQDNANPVMQRFGE